MIKTFLHLSRILASLVLVIGLFGKLPAATTNYFTAFETDDGFVNGAQAAGSGGWIGVTETTNSAYYAGAGGNGILFDYFPGMGQQAFVGQSSPGYDPYSTPFGWLSLWKPVDFDPVAVGRPIVKFTTQMAIVDSSNALYDDFYWQAWNTNGAYLFTIDFYNGNNRIYYNLAGSSSWVNTGRSYTNGTIHALAVTMNFASNVWSATLDGIPFAGPLQIAPAGTGRTLGDMDAVWDSAYNAYTYGGWGDNYMVFDDFLITSEPATLPPPNAPSLSVTSVIRDVSTTLRLTGQDGYRFAIESAPNLGAPISWSPITTNTVSGGFFDFTDTGTTGLPSRCYRARWIP